MGRQVSNIAQLGGPHRGAAGPFAQFTGTPPAVWQVFTEDDALVPTASVSATLGRFGMEGRHQARTSTPGYGLTIDA
jgi:hypothetical protein